MVQEVILNIARQIVIDWEYSKCSRVNTFFVLHNRTDWNADNMGRTYKDSLAHEFWTRDGIDKTKNHARYPALAVEINSGSFVNMSEYPDRSQFCGSFFFTLGQQVTCDGCDQDCVKTLTQIDTENFRMLGIFIGEMLNYKFYELSKVGEEVVRGWMASHRYQDFIDDGWQVEDSCGVLSDLLPSQFIPNIVINGSDFGVDNVRSVSVAMEFCDCFQETVNFKTDNTLPKVSGVVQCDGCK